MNSHCACSSVRTGVSSIMGSPPRALAPTLADHRRQRGGPLGRAQGGSGWLVAGAHARPQAADAGAGGAGQQDGPDRLGAAGQGWRVSSSGCGGVGAVTTARLSRRGRVKGEGWRNGRETGSGKPALRQALQARGPELDLIHGLPSGPAACEPHQRPHTCQHPTTGHTAPEDFSCSSRGVHTCRNHRIVPGCLPNWAYGYGRTSSNNQAP